MAAKAKIEILLIAIGEAVAMSKIEVQGEFV